MRAGDIRRRAHAPPIQAEEKSVVKNVIVRAAAVIALLGLGCKSPPTVDRLYFISGSVGEGVDIFVNGNPTNGGNALTLFLVNGRNSIELRGGVSDGWSLQVFRGNGILDRNSEKIVDRRWDLSGKTDNGSIEFDAEIGERWAWMDAESLGDISDGDKEAILTLFDSVCDEIAGAGFTPQRLLERHDVVFWSGASESIAAMKRATEELGGGFPPRSELDFRKAERGEMRMLSGKQVVMLTRDGGKVVYLGPREDTAPLNPGEVRKTFFYGFNEMFFIRRNGSWKVLISNR